jgi:signal transduction histidine kinase
MPITASQMALWMSRYDTPSNATAIPDRTTSQEASIIPSGLPTTSPTCVRLDDRPPSRIISDVTAIAAWRANSARWQTGLSTGFVLLVLSALVLLPFVNAAHVGPFHEQMRRFAEPARAEVTRIHVALALAGSLLSDYIETGDSGLARRYREAVLQEEDATRRLAPLTEQLGNTVRTRFLEVQRHQEAWHRAAEGGIAATVSRDRRLPHPLQGDEYEDLLLATAQLDEAIGEEIERYRARILAGERAQRWTTVSLALLGLGAVVVVASLAQRLRLYAGQLEERRAALERAIEGRARLMRGISHDLKNPMHAIDGHAQLLEDGILGPLTLGQQDSVMRIRRGVRSVLALVGDLLELSRAEAGHLKMARQPTDVAGLVREAVEEHRATARAAGHQLDLAVADDVTTVVTDAARVRQVLGNLISNAVKYTPGGGRIAVHAERCARDGDRSMQQWMAIHVVDSGPGIPSDQVDLIFDEFSRLPQHAAQPGSGLGLAIARRIARLMDGDVTVFTEPAGGARFTLWLPAERQQ